MIIAQDYSDILNSIGISNSQDQETIVSYLTSLINIALERYIE